MAWEEIIAWMEAVVAEHAAYLEERSEETNEIM